MRKQITSIHKRKNKQTGATVSIFLVNLLKSAGGYLICEAFGVLNPPRVSQLETIWYHLLNYAIYVYNSAQKYMSKL
jgi:hypothetical protein